MKKSMKLGLAVAFAALAASCSKSNEYVITGTVPEGFDEEITLVDPFSEEVVATAAIADTVFTIKGELPTDSLLSVKLGNGRGRTATVIAEPGRITIADGVASGTPLNDALAAFMGSITGTMQDMYAEIETSADSEAAADSIASVYGAKAADVIRETLKQNPNNALGQMALYYAVSIFNEPSDLDTLNELYGMAGERARNFKPVADAKRVMDQRKLTEPGCKMIDVAVPTGAADSTAVALSDYVGKGKYVLVDFWASWCGPCRREIPFIKEAYDKYHGDNFEVVGIDVNDTRENAKAAMEQLGIVWPVIFDASFDAVYDYGSQGIPTLILFAPDGTIAARDMRGQALVDTVAEYVGKK